MKLFVASAALASLVVSPTLGAPYKDVDHVIYVFDPDYAGGVSGTIQTFWDEGPMCDRVRITADLNFQRVDLAALAKADGNCTGPVKEYMWHIHTKWDKAPASGSNSASYVQCSKAITGNHFDPNKACGPASEYSDTPECKAKVQDYKCTPARYYESVSNCEFGDLSGKLGSIKPNKKGVAKTKWTDSLYPRWGDHRSTWNIVLHAVCGKATPRVACAVGTRYGPDHKHLKAVKAADHVKDDEVEEENEQDDNDDVGEDDDHPHQALRKKEGDDDNDDDEDDNDDDNDDNDDDNTVVLKIYVNDDE